MKLIRQIGEGAEWLKAHAWKACIGVTLSRGRIPLSPPHNSACKRIIFTKIIKLVLENKGYLMAERMGFDPMIEFPLYTLSKRAPSTTRPPLL